MSRELFEAIRANNLDKVKELIAKGANIEARDDEGWTPLHLAAWLGHEKVAQKLREAGARITILYWDEANENTLEAQNSNLVDIINHIESTVKKRTK